MGRAAEPGDRHRRQAAGVFGLALPRDCTELAACRGHDPEMYSPSDQPGRPSTRSRPRRWCAPNAPNSRPIGGRVPGISWHATDKRAHAGTFANGRLLE